MNRERARICALVAAATLAGCATVSVERVGAKVSARKSDCKIAHFDSKSKVTRPFREVAVIKYKFNYFVGNAFDGRPLRVEASIKDGVEAAKADACKLGADALVGGEKDLTCWWVAIYRRATLTLKAIHYTD